ncbi:TonB-dependent receptor [Seongchinamella sediminis]|uniref:TonB-dependent receptor n=1 Tax=Seongchinamella sediminis TaxID=2283635 RepID=A0A3L7DXC7_9GAMM|nr:TonB-dependent receptor [Seongchinamella sediminis]RLQ20631.1 TonB-dependent receptor [Seongchinamella sediminis]
MHHTRIYLALAAALVATAGTAAETGSLEELVVLGQRDSRSIEVTDALVVSADVAQLLKEAPGANVNSNGPITGIPQYRGMYGARIATSIDGTQLAPSGPNWMDPPLSYARSGQLESLQVYRGIAPVAVAQESIGGAVVAHSMRGEFSANSELRVSGNIYASLQSANDAAQLSGVIFAANHQHKLKLAAVAETGEDARFPGGKIRPTEYQRERYDIGYSLRLGEHSVHFDYGHNDTGESGTPALPMDIEGFGGDLQQLGYRFDRPGELEVEVSVFGSQLDHGMTNYHMRPAPGDAGLWRRNLADSDNQGFRIHSRLFDASGSWTFGADGFDARHNSDIDNPNNPVFEVINFNNAEREVLGVFLQRDHQWADQWRGEFGIRYNRVQMDADEVGGTPADMMPPAAALRDAFNAADREQTDYNTDLVAKFWYRFSPDTQWYAGLAQKSRSPSYQERYLWLPMEATAGLADGNTYTGNIDLDPEVARQLELGLDFSSGTLSLSPRLFYSDIEDYIQGTPSELMPAVMAAQMMSAPGSPAPLQFNNVDAVLYGFDMDWSWQLGTHWSLAGIVNYVRGERDDIDDNLYRIAPPNTSVTLGYARHTWGIQVEGVFYSAQDDVSATNREQETAGYGLMNLAASWQLRPNLQLAAGVNNLLDREYQDHLGGYNRVRNPDIALRERLPGTGTNVFARVSYSF